MGATAIIEESCGVRDVANYVQIYGFLPEDAIALIKDNKLEIRTEEMYRLLLLLGYRDGGEVEPRDDKALSQTKFKVPPKLLEELKAIAAKKKISTSKLTSRYIMRGMELWFGKFS